MSYVEQWYYSFKIVLLINQELVHIETLFLVSSWHI